MPSDATLSPPLKPSSPRLHPIMLGGPYYRRSLRPVLLLALSFLAAYLFWSQAQLREQSLYVQTVVSDRIESHFRASRTHNNTLYQQGTEDNVVREFDYATNPCRSFPNTDGIMLVLKTGATEVFEKLPTQLLTNLQCLPDFLIFSDREQQLGQWHIYDALEGVDEGVKTHFTDFELYRAQAECPLSQKTCLTSFKGQVGTAAWGLDKYKFIHMLQRSWELRPNQTWYLFGEADTYIVWDSLVDWLRNRSPVSDPLNEPAYIGSAAMLAGIPFAHGGSGYLLSGALVRDLVGANPEASQELAHTYDIKARGHCCGDQMLARAVLERRSLKVQNAHPMFNGEKPTTFPYGNTHWCDPIFTMHHMDPEEISAMWQYEQTRMDNMRRQKTILMKDLYHTFIENKMTNYRQHWDNLSDDVCYIDPNPAIYNHVDDKVKRRQKKPADLNRFEKEAYKSVSHCAKVCEYESYPVDAHEVTQEVPASQHGLQGNQPGASDAEKVSAVGPPTNGQSSNIHRRGETGQSLPAPHQRGPADAIPAPPTINPLQRRCFQYRYHKGICCTGKSFKLGEPRREAKAQMPDKPEEIWHSGWYMKGINEWIRAKGECKGPKWKVPDKL